jgi:rSAM/selenodomain-associated transferase 2
MIAAMISVIIPTLNEEADLARTLTALVPAAIEGLVRDVVVADGGSSDRTAEIAEVAGAHFIRTEAGRGAQLAEGTRHAKAEWLLFLHADTALQPGWEEEAVALIRAVETGAREETAAVFRFALDDTGLRAAALSALVGLRCAMVRMPYGDQGLLISRRLYDQVGGYKPLALMEDLDLVRRLGRRRIVLLRSRAVTSARRYRRDGYARRMLRNLACLSLYFLRVPPRVLARLYG